MISYFSLELLFYFVLFNEVYTKELNEDSEQRETINSPVALPIHRKLTKKIIHCSSVTFSLNWQSGWNKFLLIVPYVSKRNIFSQFHCFIFLILKKVHLMECWCWQRGHCDFSNSPFLRVTLNCNHHSRFVFSDNSSIQLTSFLFWDTMMEISQDLKVYYNFGSCWNFCNFF